MRRLRVLVGLMTTIGMLGTASPTQAIPITYTETSVASGTLGGIPFTDAEITVTLTANTSGVIEPLPEDFPGVLLNAGAATITIAGLGTAAFNDPNGYAAIVFPELPDEGILIPGMIIAQFDNALGDSFTHILGVMDDSLAGYALQGPFGPVSNTGFGVVTSDVIYSTTAGILAFTGGGDPVTLTVTTEAVPEPAIVSLFGVSGLGAIAARRRRRKQHP